MVIAQTKPLIHVLYFCDGVEQNYKKVLHYYRTLAINDDSIGMHRLALMYFYGKGVLVDYNWSFTILQRVIDNEGWNDYRQKYIYEREYVTERPFVYQQSSCTKSNPQIDLVYCTMNITRVKGESKYYIGLVYNKGLGILPDEVKAQSYFREAYRDGFQRAHSEFTSYFDD
jgi:TPR repeat protein